MATNPPRIYLDHAATSPLAPGVLDAMLPYLTEKWHSPGALYRSARALKRELDDAHRRAAALLGVQPAEIVFTGSGTESINLAIRGVALASQHRGRHLITTQIEHRAVLDTAKQLEKQGWRVSYLPVDASGCLDLAALEAALDDETVLVSVMLANNEIGTLQPLADVVRVVKARNSLIPVHTDAVAAAGFHSVAVADLGVDLLTLSGHKLGGPKGVGLLWARRGVLLQSILTGDDRERGRRAGMENLPAIMGMVVGMEEILPYWQPRAAQVGELTDRLCTEIARLVPGTVVVGAGAARVPQIASFCFEHVDGEALLQQLDVQGIAVGAGSACASATLEPSHVLKALGIPLALAEGNLRLSLGPENTAAEIDRVLEVLPAQIARMRALRS